MKPFSLPRRIAGLCEEELNLVDNALNRMNIQTLESTIPDTCTGYSRNQIRRFFAKCLTETTATIAIVDELGEMAEWLKAPVSKTGICNRI